MITILWMGGTGFGNGGDGISLEFRAVLERRDSRLTPRFRFEFVPYPADFGNRLNYEESVAEGQNNLVRAIEQCETPVILGGYSQGAAVAGNVAAWYARGHGQHLDIRGVVLISDPGRPASTTGTGDKLRPYLIGSNTGYGISGEREIPGPLPVLWVANEGDPITALPAGNPLRSIADMTEYMAATADPDRAWALAQKVIARAAEGRMQQWWSWKNWRTWGGALAYARGYLFDGRHTDDYVFRGLCAEAAQTVLDANYGDLD